MADLAALPVPPLEPDRQPSCANCRDGGGWVQHEDGSVEPCAACRPATRERWTSGWAAQRRPVERSQRLMEDLL